MVKRKKPEALLKGWVELSSLPFIYIKINNAINDRHSSIRDISDIISGDPSLTTRLLRLVNSAFYGFAIENRHGQPRPSGSGYEPVTRSCPGNFGNESL